MANFEAKVRTTYRDVAGLVLSCARDDVVEDPNNLGFVREWINRAPGIPSQPAIRQPGDPAPTYLGGRFTNPIQKDQSLQPTLAFTGGLDKRVQFDRSRSTFMECELLTEALPGSVQYFAAGYQFTPGGDATAGQVVFSSENGEEIKLFRLNGLGNAQVSMNGGFTVMPGDHPAGTFLFTGETGDTLLWEQDGGAFDTGDAFTGQIPIGSQMQLGRDQFGNFLDGTLDSLHIWMAELSPLSQDLIWQTLNEDGSNFSTDLRAPMSSAVWTDLTGDLLLDQYDRLRPQTGFPHRYIKVTLPASPAPHRVQVACSVDGLVLPNSQLGGDFFTYSFAEAPGPPFISPAQNFDGDHTMSNPGDWSSVVDFSLTQEGHYTLVCTRANGGSIILHFDVEVG